MKTLANCVIVTDWLGDKCLFGQIYNDERFPEGHHILTTKIVKLHRMTAQTKSGTTYNIRNLMGHSEFEKLIDKNYHNEEYKAYLKSFVK